MTPSCLESRLRILGVSMLGASMDRNGVRVVLRLRDGTNIEAQGKTFDDAVGTALSRLVPPSSDIAVGNA
jgi:hypothetical protein